MRGKPHARRSHQQSKQLLAGDGAVGRSHRLLDRAAYRGLNLLVMPWRSVNVGSRDRKYQSCG